MINQLTKIKIILLNGFVYQGIQQPNEQGFICLLDSKDGKIKKFPNSAISLIEVQA